MDKTYKKTVIIKRALYYGLHMGRMRMGDKMKYNQIILPDSFPSLCNKKYLGRRGSTCSYYINDREVEAKLLDLTRTLTGVEFDPKAESNYSAFFFYVEQTEDKTLELRFTQSSICYALNGFWFDVYISDNEDFMSNLYLTTKILW